ncbi:MAG TPA: hypothetical protein VF797_04905 [Noviherbaspirillum sp.]
MWKKKKCVRSSFNASGEHIVTCHVMFQASLLAPVYATAGSRLAGIARIFRYCAAHQSSAAGRVKDQTHMEGKDNEKMVIVDDAWAVEHPAVGLWL